MKQNVKASTLVETLIASVVIIISFSCFLMISGDLMRKLDIGRDYIDMRHSRDSVVAAISEKGVYGKFTVNKKWGLMKVSPLNDNRVLTEVEIVSEMLNGQSYRQVYLIYNDQGI